VEDHVIVPASFELRGNYPNPFNPSTTIIFSLKEASTISLDIYNLKGQKVSTLTSGTYGAGEHALTWNGTDAASNPVASGMYLYKLSTPRGSSLKKCVLLK